MIAPITVPDRQKRGSSYWPALLLSPPPISFTLILTVVSPLESYYSLYPEPFEDKWWADPDSISETSTFQERTSKVTLVKAEIQ